MQSMMMKVGAVSRRQGILLAATAGIMWAGHAASGQTLADWDGGGGDGKWLTATNWNPDTTPTIAGDSIATINNGQTATISGAESADASFLILGTQTGQSGRVEVSGGTLTLGEMRIGGVEQLPAALGGGPNAGGTGEFVQSGGVVNVNSTLSPSSTPVQSLYLADGGLTSGNTAVGTYNLSAGNLNVGVNVDDEIVVGTRAGSVGNWIQSGGVASSSGRIFFGRWGATANASLSGGTLTSVGSMNIADGNGTATGTLGTLTQTGGLLQTTSYQTITTVGTVSTTSTVTGAMYVGRNGGTGTYKLGPAGTAIIAGDLWVGNAESGTLATSGSVQQTGGNVTVGAVLGVGRLAGIGDYSISGGSVKAGNINIGYGGTGSMTQSLSNVTSTLSMSVGITATSTGVGTYQLDSGSLTVGTGAGDVLAVGNGLNSIGTLTQNNGTVSTGVGTLQLGRNNGSTGTYNLNGGTVTVGSTLFIGGGNNQTSGNGTFNQAAGTTLTASADFNLGGNASSTVSTSSVGTYNMNGGVLNLTKASAFTWGIGNGLNSTGIMNQTGGTVTVSNSGNNGIDIGRNNGGGSYTLGGTGKLSIHNSMIALASGSTGVARSFVLKDTAILDAGTLTFGSGATSIPRTLSMTGGTSTIGNLNLGNLAPAAGRVEITGGSHTLTTMSVGTAVPTFAGTASVSVGTLNTGTGTLTIGGSANVGVTTALNMNTGSRLVTSRDMNLTAAPVAWGSAALDVNGANVTFGAGSSVSSAVRTMTLSGTGSLSIGGTQSYTLGSKFISNIASLNLNSDTGSASNTLGASVDANSGTVVSLNNVSHRLNVVNVAAGAAVQMPANGNRTLVANALTITGSGEVDMNDNDLVVNTTPFTTVKAAVLSGFGAPNGGITSSTSDGSQILALFDNSLIGAGTWNGMNIGTSAVVGKYTYFGDVNFDGQVTGDDYTIVDSNLNTTPAVGLEWLSGDANLDGIVTGDDYTTIDSNLGLGVGNPLSASSLGGGLTASSLGGVSAVPEPGSVGLIVAASGGMLLRRRRGAK